MNNQIYLISLEDMGQDHWCNPKVLGTISPSEMSNHIAMESPSRRDELTISCPKWVDLKELAEVMEAHAVWVNHTNSNYPDKEAIIIKAFGDLVTGRDFYRELVMKYQIVQFGWPTWDNSQYDREEEEQY